MTPTRICLGPWDDNDGATGRTRNNEDDGANDGLVGTDGRTDGRAGTTTTEHGRASEYDDETERDRRTHAQMTTRIGRTTEHDKQTDWDYVGSSARTKY